jgi:hypothetical protein
MFNKKIALLITVLAFVGMACASPSSLTSDEITNVAGVVYDAESYERIANAQVIFSADDKSATTNEEGTFVLREVSVGTHTVTIQTDGHGTVEKSVEIVNGGTRLELAI